MTTADTPRPYRLWHAKLKAFIPHRYYTHLPNAHMGALILARWSRAGVTIEVIDIRTSRLMGQYTRLPTSVRFTKVIAHRKETNHAQAQSKKPTPHTEPAEEPRSEG